MPITRARKVLYLDFDGVLHHGEVYWHPKRGIYIKEPGYALFEWMHILEELLAPYPDVAIVLATSWVRSKSFEFAKKQLSPALQRRVIGATFHKAHMREESFSLLPRGVQILGDVGRRQPEFWLSIDDDDEDWPIEHRHHLVRTEPHLGLSDPNAQEAMRLMLKRSEVWTTGAVADASLDAGRRIGIAK